MSTLDVNVDAAVIVRWTDASGPMEARFGPELPWQVRLDVLLQENDDWGEISIRNPDGQEILWCSGNPAQREAARRAVGSWDEYQRRQHPAYWVQAKTEAGS